MANYYSEDLIQTIIDANDLVDLISGYLTLKRTGQSYKGKCPFHNEKTPSFSVSREKQLYHCFGCGAGGNVITFVMEMEKLSFIDALKYLAERSNITLPDQQNKEEDQSNYEHKKRLYVLHRDAANFLYKNLKMNQSSLNYLLERGISLKTIKTFGLGYANDDWNHLEKFLKSKNYSNAEILDSGLIMISQNNRLYDRFRDRLMFPILNPRKQILGFGGRIMSQDAKAPKYLNSPETQIFSKSYELYNLNNAKNFLENGQLYIVEGYMDVISLYEKGIKNAVASLGTAFTPFHGKLLERYANEIILVFDGDSAGQSATEKAIKTLKKTDINVKIIDLPKAEDPDSFIQGYGLQAFNDLSKKALTAIEYQLIRLKEQFDLSQTDGRIGYGNATIKILKDLSSKVELDFYTQQIAKETGIRQNVIRSEIIRGRAGKTPEKLQVKKEEGNEIIPKAYQRAQEMIVHYCLDHPKQANQVPEEYLSNKFLKKLIKELRLNNETNAKELIVKFQNSSEIQTIVKLMMDDEEVSELDFQDALEISKRFYSELEMDKILNQIQTATHKGDDLQVAELMNQLIEIKKMMKENTRR